MGKEAKIEVMKYIIIGESLLQISAREWGRRGSRDKIFSENHSAGNQLTSY